MRCSKCCSTGSFKQGDTKPLAKALLARFGSIAEVLGAPEHLLLEVKGCGPVAAFDLNSSPPSPTA